MPNSLSDTCIIRAAAPADLPAILNLVRELAVYEKEPEAVTASIDDYRQAFEEGVFEALVAEVRGKVLGIALYFLCYSTWKGKMLYLDDLVVKNGYRGRGIGRRLFEAVIEEGRRKEAKLLKWQVLDWNKPAIAFYEKYDAVIEKNWWNGKIPL